MKMKKQLTLFCTALLTIGSVCGCSSSAASMDATQSDTGINEELSQPMTLAEITAIDGTTVTLQLLGGRGGRGMGENPQAPDDAERPDMPEGAERPEKGEGQQPPDMETGERPEIPEGSAPPEKEHPEMSNEQKAPNDAPPASEPMTVDLSAFDAIDITELAVGDFLSLTMDSEGNVTAIEKADLPEMPTEKSPDSEA